MSLVIDNNVLILIYMAILLSIFLFGYLLVINGCLAKEEEEESLEDRISLFFFLRNEKLKIVFRHSIGLFFLSLSLLR